MRSVLFFMVMALVSCGKPEVKEETPASAVVSPAPIPAPAPSVLKDSWPIVDRVLSHRVGYTQILKLDELPHGKEYQPAYFHELKKRKAHVIAWAREHHPTISFIGQVHVSLAGGNTADSQQEVARVQSWVFNELTREAKDADVITFEQYGTNERVTPEVMKAMTKADLKAFGPLLPPGMPVPTDKDIDEMFAQDQQAATRAIRELPNLPIYCGEEWPNALESFVLMARLNQAPPDLRQIVLDFVNDFDRLRSEIILTRTLEFLEQKNGKKGVIVQGLKHGPDVAAVADEYHTNVNLVMPTALRNGK